MSLNACGLRASAETDVLLCAERLTGVAESESLKLPPKLDPKTAQAGFAEPAADEPAAAASVAAAGFLENSELSAAAACGSQES